MTINARFSSSGNRRRSAVSRCSLQTTNSSLPGCYSHRNRTFAAAVLLAESYCSSALVNILGVTV